MVIRRTVLHNLSVSAIHRTMQSIANQQKLLYIFGSKMEICVGDEFDSTNQLLMKVTVRVRFRVGFEVPVILHVTYGNFR